MNIAFVRKCLKLIVKQSSRIRSANIFLDKISSDLSPHVGCWWGRVKQDQMFR